MCIDMGRWAYPIRCIGERDRCGDLQESVPQLHLSLVSGEDRQTYLETLLRCLTSEFGRKNLKSNRSEIRETQSRIWKEGVIQQSHTNEASTYRK